MLGGCYLYRHQMYFHTDIHGISLLLPISSKENSKLCMGYFDSDFDNDQLA